MIEHAVRDLVFRSGNHTSCGGVAKILVDAEPADRFEFVDAHDERWTGGSDRELIDQCVGAVRRAVLEEAGGDPPPIRFVLRRILVHEVDSNEHHNLAVGRMAIRALSRTA